VHVKYDNTTGTSEQREVKEWNDKQTRELITSWLNKKKKKNWPKKWGGQAALAAAAPSPLSLVRGLRIEFWVF